MPPAQSPPPEAPAGIAHADAPAVPRGAPLPADPMAALDGLTQLHGSSALAGAHACGALSLVAATIATRGYAGLHGLAESLRGELADDTRGLLERLAECVASGGEDATYGALAEYALVLHRRYRGFDRGMPYDTLRQLLRAAGFQPPRAPDDDDIPGTMRSARCWPAKIALRGGGDGDHWVLVGKDARGLFLYDPWPREDGSQIVRPGEADWPRYARAIGQDEAERDTIGFLPPA